MQTDSCSTDISRQRMTWLDRAISQEGCVRNGRMLSTQGLLLLRDIERAFCAGAWLSVVVLAYAVVDATLRDVATGDYKSKAADLYGSNPDLDWLRTLRNEIVHVSPPGSPSGLWKLPATDLSACHEALEHEAQRAVALAYRQVFAQQAGAQPRP
ncbi:MAG: hypothetical protein V4593_01945 [Pseudomonadota bacterium]